MSERLDERVRNGVCLICGGAVLGDEDHLDPRRHDAAVRDAALAEAADAILDLTFSLTGAATNREGMLLANGASKGVSAIRRLRKGTSND